MVGQSASRHVANWHANAVSDHTICVMKVTSDECEAFAEHPRHVHLDCLNFVAIGLLKLARWREAWVASRTG